MKNYDILSQLREKAEKALASKLVPFENDPTLPQLKELFNELQIYELELEMQNDELRSSYLLLENERLKFSNLFDFAPVGYFILDKSGFIENVNRAGTDILQGEKQQIKGERFAKFLVPSSLNAFYYFLRNINISGMRESCTVKMINNLQEEFHAQLEGFRLPPSKKEPRVEYLFAIIDITKRRQAEENLKNAKIQLETALSASHTSTWLFDPDTSRFSFDKFSYALLGLEEWGFDGKYSSFINFVHSSDKQKADAAFKSTIEGRKDLNVELRIIDNAEREHILLVSGKAVSHDDGRRRVLGTFTDVTEIRILEAEKAEQEENQKKLIAAGAFKAEETERKRISENLHDSVGQLLYGIRLNIEQIKRNHNSPDVQKVFELIDETIRQTRNISFELAPSILVDYGLKSTLEEMASRLSGNEIQIAVDTAKFSGRLSSSMESHIYRITQELVNNALKHSKASKIDIELKKRNKSIEIRVSDNGAGFDTNTPHSGSGLSSIKNRLRLYSGSMKIDTQPGKGTSVFIRIKEVDYDIK